VIRIASALVLAAGLGVLPTPARADDPDHARPALDHARPCHDRTDLVGYRRCEPYGMWGSSLREDNVFVAFGVNLRRFGSSSRSGAIARATGATTTSPTELLATDEVLTFDQRMGYSLPYGVYFAVDFELGNFAYESERGGRNVLLGAAVAGGLRADLLIGALSAELVGGARAYSYASDHALSGEGVLEARARADLWITPWFTLGGTIGTSLIRGGEWLAGIYLGFHSHAYAGSYR
jgi:hypothetical protein